MTVIKGSPLRLSPIHPQYLFFCQYWRPSSPLRHTKLVCPWRIPSDQLMLLDFRYYTKEPARAKLALSIAITLWLNGFVSYLLHVSILFRSALLFGAQTGSWIGSAASSCWNKLLFTNQWNRPFQIAFSVRSYIANTSSQGSASYVLWSLLIIFPLANPDNAPGHFTMMENPRVGSFKSDAYLWWPWQERSLGLEHWLCQMVISRVSLMCQGCCS